MAQAIERKTRHQHHFYLTGKDITQESGYQNAKLVKEVGAGGRYFGAQLVGIIEQFARGNATTTFAGEITAEGAQELGGTILEIASTVASAFA